MLLSTTERHDEAFEDDVRLTVIGARLRPGDRAPDCTLDQLGEGQVLPTAVTFWANSGKTRIFHTINSVETPVCHADSCRWDALWRGRLPADVELINVSMDLPFTLARWRRETGVGFPALSAHRDEGFGRDFGVLLKEWRLLQRAVIVVDGRGTVLHAEYVADQNASVDCNAVLQALNTRDAHV